MINVYFSHQITPLMNSSHAHFLAFDIEPNHFKRVTDIKDADIIPVLGSSSTNVDKQIEVIKKLGYDGQTIVVLNLFHVDDQSDTGQVHQSQKERWHALTKNVVIVHTNENVSGNVFYDLLWNRQKAYFTEYDKFDMRDRVWSWAAGKKMYTLSAIQKSKNVKHFLSPNRIYYHAPEHPRTAARIKLKEFLEPFDEQGYISDPGNQKILISEETEANISRNLLEGGGGTWWPVANSLYESTFASVYTETITTSIYTKTITEKTWDPLIKGHFIIPYAYPGLIKDLKSRGFKFPAWINYDYDDITRDDLRFRHYLKSVEEFLRLDIEYVRKLYNKDKDILEHNRQLFFTKPYDSLYEKLKPYINS